MDDVCHERFKGSILLAGNKISRQSLFVINSLKRPLDIGTIWCIMHLNRGNVAKALLEAPLCKTMKVVNPEESTIRRAVRIAELHKEGKTFNTISHIFGYHITYIFALYKWFKEEYGNK